MFRISGMWLIQGGMHTGTVETCASSHDPRPHCQRQLLASGTWNRRRELLLLLLLPARRGARTQTLGPPSTGGAWEGG